LFSAVHAERYLGSMEMDMSGLNRRTLIMTMMMTPLAAHAQNWPAPGTTIKIVVPFPPGGSVDAIARVLLPGLQQRLGVTMIVDNRTGASGSVGTDAVAKSKPDGTNWLFMFDNLVLNPFILPKLPFDTEKDLAPVFLLGKAPYIVCTNPNKPYKTLADIIKAAKAQPGKISFGTPGSGSLGHLAMMLLAKEAGVDIVHVPYRGAAPALNDAIAGQIDLFVGSVAIATPQIQGGAVRAIVQLGEKRAAAVADVPTASESGFPSIIADAWWGFFAPAGTPAEIIKRFNAAVVEVLREEKVSKQITESQQVTLVNGGPEELRKFVHDQMRLWGPVVRENHIQAN
jgi:tripartite-type tricarboxylate transporter receptor subunit TctC